MTTSTLTERASSNTWRDRVALVTGQQLDAAIESAAELTIEQLEWIAYSYHRLWDGPVHGPALKKAWRVGLEAADRRDPETLDRVNSAIKNVMGSRLTLEGTKAGLTCWIGANRAVERLIVGILIELAEPSLTAILRAPWREGIARAHWALSAPAGAAEVLRCLGSEWSGSLEALMRASETATS